MLDVLFVLIYVVLINWNIGLYTLALSQKGRTKAGVIAINIIVSLVLAYFSIYY
jgi:hypothetical protein